MRSLLSSSLFLLSALCSAQNGKQITLDPGIDRVTVYLNGGEIRATAEVDLAAGLNTILLKELSQQTYTQSVQVAIKGDIAILSVNPSDDRIPPERSEPRIARLQDSLRLLDTRIVEVTDRMGASQAAKDMLSHNYSIGGANAALTSEALAKANEYFLDRTLKLNRDISTANGERAGLDALKRKVQEDLQKLENSGGRDRKKVTVLVNADRAQHVRLELRYLVANTGWSPAYDLVAMNNTSPITLRYKAQVYNNTGIDWSKMNLTLSTADPSLGASSPELIRWELDNRSETRFGGEELKLYQSQGSVEQGINFNADPTHRYELITVSEVTAEFAIKRTYDVPSDGRPYMVEVAEHTLPAEYRYVAVPKLDRDAFLQARITGWEDLDLVDGPANVYYEDRYIGESMIRTAGINDTMDLSLGRDNDIRVERKELEDRASRKAIGNERKQTMTYDITVKNNSSAPVRLTLRDQVPVSMDDQIKVEVLELSKGELNAPDGFVDWPMQLEPGASNTVKLSFSIRHPKSWNVKYRTRIRRQKVAF